MKPMSCLAAAGISLCLVLQAGAQTRTGYKLQPGDVCA